MTLTPEHLDRLLELAEKATPGPYFCPPQHKGLNQRVILMEEIVREFSPTKPLATICMTAWRPQRAKSIRPTAEYFAALDPATVKALVAMARGGR